MTCFIEVLAFLQWSGVKPAISPRYTLFLFSHQVMSNSFATPIDCSLPGSSVHGISQARILEWVAISFSRGSSWSSPGVEPTSPVLAGRFFTTESPRKPQLANYSGCLRLRGLPTWLRAKVLPVNVGDSRDGSLIPGSERSPREGNSNPLQYSCLKNSMDRGAWRANKSTGVTKTQTWLSTHTQGKG